ncbi:hypothetical protein LDENG_00289880 [Lucifuga dentata]|nr:hypothetical protein LDENG_00289880 [Lucifuga dentata]
MMQIKRKESEVDLMIEDRHKRIKEINRCMEETKVGSNTQRIPPKQRKKASRQHQTLIFISCAPASPHARQIEI